MSINIPSGSSNPIGAKMGAPSASAPPPSESTKQAVQNAFQERWAPEHLKSESGETSTSAGAEAMDTKMEMEFNKAADITKGSSEDGGGIYERKS